MDAELRRATAGGPCRRAAPGPPGRRAAHPARRAPLRPHALPRVHLVDRLRTISAPGRLTLIAAGAGWGKTTLVASWIREERDRAAWFSVDATDSDPVRFWGAVIAALDGVAPGVATRSARLLGAPGTSTATDVVPALVDGLGTEDLRLSAAESAELLATEAAATGTAWTPDDAARLHARTEGWVIGVHLGVLSRRSHPALTVPSGPGRARHLVDYLRREVFAPLPDDLREVLRRTAVLDVFRADLAAAVTGRPDAASLLARAEREQLFVVPLDDRGDWYRFHHLFAEVLRDDLEAAEPDLVPQLHARAARWWAAHDQPVAAARHALAGDDPELAAAPVARHAPVLTRIGQVETALGWFRALGDDTCRADPRLAVARALTGAHTGRPHEIVSWTAVAERALDDPPASGPHLAPPAATAARIEIAMMRWAATVFAGEAAASLRHVEEVLRLLPAGAGPPSGFILLALGVARFRSGEQDASWAALVEAESVAEDRGEPLAVVAARGLRALQAALGGRPEEATRLADGAETVAERHGLVEHFNTATARAAHGWVALHTGRPRRAVDHFRRALELVRRGGLRLEVAEVLTALASAEERLGRHAAADGHRDEARQVLASCPDPGYVWADPRAEPDPPEHDGVPLSRRQAEILALLAEALTTAEIGERLKLSPRTVEAHLRTLYRKIDVRSRTAAARYAVEHGMTASRHSR